MGRHNKVISDLTDAMVEVFKKHEVTELKYVSAYMAQAVARIYMYSHDALHLDVTFQLKKFGEALNKAFDQYKKDIEAGKN